MRISSLLIVALLGGGTGCADTPPDVTTPNEDAFVSLFDGETLAGWRVNEGTTYLAASERWTVERGAIRGRFLNHFEVPEGTDRPVNTWLVSEYVYSDFDLRFSFRIDAGNSGFTYRSIIGAEALDSPEVDLDTGETTGQIYDTRTIGGDYVNKDYLTTVDAALLAQPYRHDEWNQMRLLLSGPNVKVWLNDVLLTDYDHDPSTPAGRPEGHIAMELHGSTIANFKDIRIRELE